MKSETNFQQLSRSVVLDTSTCNYNDNSSSISDSKRRYGYVKVGRTNASEVEESCQVEKMFRTLWPTNNDDPNISYIDALNELAYGFELSLLGRLCESYCPMSKYCYQLHCDSSDIVIIFSDHPVGK